jgi:hypothetical protein
VSYYQATHFKLEEFLPPQLFADLAARNQLWKGWMILDERMVRTADQLREKLGLLIINDWHRGGTRDECGLRTPGMANYKVTSQHSYGRAADAISKTLSAEDMRKYIRTHLQEFPFLTRIERGVSWLHFDVGNATQLTEVDP